jgi:DNA repair ATPase RecN
MSKPENSVAELSNSGLLAADVQDYWSQVVTDDPEMERLSNRLMSDAAVMEGYSRDAVTTAKNFDAAFSALDQATTARYNACLSENRRIITVEQMEASVAQTVSAFDKIRISMEKVPQKVDDVLKRGSCDLTKALEELPGRMDEIFHEALEPIYDKVKKFTDFYDEAAAKLDKLIESATYHSQDQAQAKGPAQKPMKTKQTNFDKEILTTTSCPKATPPFQSRVVSASSIPRPSSSSTMTQSPRSYRGQGTPTKFSTHRDCSSA